MPCLLVILTLMRSKNKKGGYKMKIITKKISGKEAINLFGSNYEKKDIVKIEQDSVFLFGNYLGRTIIV